MSRRLHAPVNVRLADDAAERVRLSHESRIREIQSVPIVQGRIFRDVVLAAGVVTPVAHGLGRRAAIFLSPPRGLITGVGCVQEIRSGVHEPTQFVVLQADGWGATVTVDVWAF